MHLLILTGESLPSTTIINWMKLNENFSTNNILGALFGLACGVLAGYLLLAFWPRRKKLYGSMLWMGILCLVMGFLIIQLPVFTRNHISYVAAYAVIFAAAQGKLSL